MLAAYAAPSSPSSQRAHMSARPELLSPPLPVSPSELELQLAPTSVKEKRRKQVPASSRGGLGNIRARKQPKLDSKDTSCQSPSSISSRLSTSTFSTSRFRRVLSVGSNSTMSSASSEYSTVDSVAATDGSGGASMASGSSGVGGGYAAFSDSGPPLSVMFGSPESRRTKGKGKSKVIISASAEYALHLQTDARQRALEKHLAKARAKEESRSLGQEIDRGNEKVAKSRMGRGGAGVYKTIQTGVDPSLHPHAATITQEYEARAAAHEREIISASRTRSALKGSTGRGGAGNVGFGGKTVETRAKKERKKKDVKGKGKARTDAHDAGENGEGCITEARGDGEADDDATIAIDDPSKGMDHHRKKRPGFRGLLQRVIRPHADVDSTLRDTAGLDESTPRPSMDGNVLEIGQPSARSHWDISTSSSSLMSPQPSRMPRRLSRYKEEAREGAELLAFVHAALPDLRSAQNVLGVPGTPGFPRPDGRSVSNANAGSSASQSAASSGSSTPLNGRASARTGDNDVFQEVDHRPFQSGRMEEIMEEEWVDDETLQEDAEDEHSFVKEDDEDEDSDIDPQLVTSAYKKQQQFVPPEYDIGNRHDSPDAVIRVALDKFDRIEIKDKVDDAPIYDEAGIIDAHTSTGDGNDGSRNRANLHSSPLPAFLTLQPAPRYLRTSAPALPARFYTDSWGAPTTKVGVQSRKPRAVIPVASPPPTRPVPRIPGHN